MVSSGLGWGQLGDTSDGATGGKFLLRTLWDLIYMETPIVKKEEEALA